METKEEREARLHALEVEQELLNTGIKIGEDLLTEEHLKQLKDLSNAGTWTVDDQTSYYDTTRKTYTRVDNGDEYTVPKHKHMDKLIKLEDRIAHWKAIGPACTEDEWEQMLKDLDGVTNTRRACSMDTKYAIPKILLKAFNKMWNKYKIK
tara:strand:+ start:335 stop:787 length:453 start_codon:yes stop_codon:yes gene_type:complete